MKPVPLHPNLPTPTTAFGNPAPIAQYYTCPHCNKPSPLVREWVGLTEEEREAVYQAGQYEDYIRENDVQTLARAIEAKLKEKNQ